MAQSDRSALLAHLLEHLPTSERLRCALVVALVSCSEVKQGTPSVATGLLACGRITHVLPTVHV